MKHQIPSLFLAALLCGCASNKQVSSDRPQATEMIAVNAEDGISKYEAYSIGLRHFSTYGIACGCVAFPEDKGDYWSVVTLVGVGAVPREELSIRKSDGMTEIRIAKSEIQK